MTNKNRKNNHLKMMITSFLSIGLVLSSIGVPSYANVNEFSTNGLKDEEKIQKIEKYIEETIDQNDIPGLSIAIVDKGETIYLNGFGKTGKGSVKVTENTPFILGSISKSFTALAVQQLASEGKLSLDDAVAKHLSWFTVLKEDNSEITIRELMDHTSGFTSGAGEQAYLYNPDYTLETLSKRINQIERSDFADIPDELVSNSKYQFSNLNYILLGSIIESVSQMSYEEYIEKNIIKPLDLSQTKTDYKSAYSSGLAMGHRVVYGFVLKTEIPYPQALLSSNYLISSASDMAKYMTAVLNNGYALEGTSLLSNNAQPQIEFADQVNDNLETPYLDSRWEFMTQRDANNYNGYYGVFGILPNYNSALLINPDDKIGVLVMTNQTNFYSTPSVTAQTIANDITDLLNNKVPKTFDSRENISLWALILLALFVSFWMIRNFIKMYRQLKDSKEPVKVFEFNEVIRGIASLILYIGYPIFQDNDWGYFVGSNPEYVFPAFLLIVVNLLVVIASITIKFITNQKKKSRA